MKLIRCLFFFSLVVTIGCEPVESDNDIIEVSNAGTEVSNAGAESSNAGTEVSNAGTEVSNAGAESSNAGTEVSNAGTDASYSPYGMNGCSRRARLIYAADSSHNGSWNENVNQSGDIVTCDVSNAHPNLDYSFHYSFLESEILGSDTACDSTIDYTYDEEGYTIRYDATNTSVRWDFIETGHYIIRESDDNYLFGDVDVFLYLEEENSIKVIFYSDSHAERIVNYSNPLISCDGLPEAIAPNLCEMTIEFYEDRVVEISGDGICAFNPSNYGSEDVCSHADSDADGVEDWTVIYSNYECE